MLYAHVVIMLYAHVVSSYYFTLGFYARVSVFPIISHDRSCCSPCLHYTTQVDILISKNQVLQILYL